MVHARTNGKTTRHETNASHLFRLRSLLLRSDQLSIKINKLIAGGTPFGPEMTRLESARTRIETEMSEVLGDEIAGKSPRTVIWRVRAALEPE